MTTSKKEEKRLSDYIRVTEVLDPYFDKSSIPPGVLEKAQERGTEVHDAIEMLLKGLGMWISPVYEPYIESFQRWVQATGFCSDNIVCLEHRMFNDELMLTGQCDLICTLGEETVLLDFKTSHSPSKSWPLQLSAYRFLSDVEIDKAIVLHLQKDGGAAKIYEYPDMWDLYKKAYDVYVHFNPKKLKGKKNDNKKNTTRKSKPLPKAR